MGKKNDYRLIFRSFQTRLPNVPINPETKMYGTWRSSVIKKGLRILELNSKLAPLFRTEYSADNLIRNEKINVRKNFADIKNPRMGWTNSER